MSVSANIDNEHEEALELDRRAAELVRPAELTVRRTNVGNQSVTSGIAAKKSVSYQQAVDKIINSESTFEKRMENVRSIIAAGNEAVEKNESYGVVKSYVDAAYAQLRAVDRAPLAEEEKKIFEELGMDVHYLAMDLSRMDEPTE